MEHLLNSILEQYTEQIQPIIESDLSNIQNVRLGIECSQHHIHQFRSVVRDKSFASQEEEIKFFKCSKPYVYGRLKFFVNLNNYLLQKPQGSFASQRMFVDEAIERLESHKLKYIDFICYYRQGKTNLDKYYFVRGKDNIALASNTSHYYTDPNFSTSHDNMVAQIIAYDLLTKHYSQELDHLQKKERNLTTSNTEPVFDNPLLWSASKTDLVELIYALQAAGAIQNGRAEIKKMAQYFEKLFDLELGNYYRTYLEIKERKNDRTNFLSQLKYALERKMTDDDAKY